MCSLHVSFAVPRGLLDVNMVNAVARMKRVLALLCIVCSCWLMSALGGAADDGFVRIQGDQFVYRGEVYKLKGTNYYPRDHMWADMWSSWDWSEIQLEANMLPTLNINCVRILVPYSYGGWNGPNVPPDRLQKLNDIVNLFGEKGIRSCITLFDWETTFPAAGTTTEANHIAYLNAIVNRLKNNQYVLMWDVKNEPDHPANIGGYDDWDYSPANKAKIISWLNRMCDAVRARDPNHPVTVGLRWYNNVSDIIHFEDIACFHSYWRTTINTVQIPTVKACTSKPIVVQEYGWPSNPTPCHRDGYWIYDYNESEQTTLYSDHLSAFANHNIAGGMQWMTFDSRNYTTDPDVSFENYFGLWRYDYTLKPAALYYRDHFVVRPFPKEIDPIAPGNVTSLSATVLTGAIRLSWTNPTDSDLRGIMIRCKTTGYPSGPTDGSLVCDVTASPGTTGMFYHSGLTNGVVYYYRVFSYDAAPNYSGGMPIAAIPGKIRCSQARNAPDDVRVSLGGKFVSAIFTGDCIYVEEQDRSAGIRVAWTGTGLALGDKVDISGIVTSRKPDGAIISDRQISSATVTKVSPAVNIPVEAIAMNCRSVGGEAVSPLVPGVRDGVGLNNIGLLVCIMGKVTWKSGDCIWVDDGSRIEDPTAVGVMVRCPSSSIPVNEGDFVTATGVVEGNIPPGWTTNRRCVRIRSFTDLKKVQ